MIPDVKPELQEMIDNIAEKNMYYNNPIPGRIMAMFEIKEDIWHCGVLVPFWLSVLQYGRGPRKSTQSSNLWQIIYKWMERRNMFRRAARGRFASRENKINQAKSLTWYINKYGNAHFRSQTFIDIYETERRKTIEKINAKFSEEISRITMEVI